MKVLFPLIVFLLFLPPVMAQVNQEWIATFDNSPESVFGQLVASDNEGNVIATGVSQLIQDWRLLTIKYNASGQVLWVKQYSKPQVFPEARDMKTDPSGNIYVLANQVDPSLFNSGTLLIKYFPNGDTAWTRLIRSSSPDQHSILPVGLKIDNQGDVFLLCSDLGQIGGSSTLRDYVVFKYNGNGELLLSRFIDNNFTEDHPQSMDLDDAGNIGITGYSINPDNTLSVFTVKLNGSGVLQWSKLRNDVVGMRVSFDSAGNVIVAGTLGTSVPAPVQNIIVIKYNNPGSIVWERMFQEISGDNNAIDLGLDNAGNIYVLGQFFPGDMITVKYNSNGVRQWFKTFAADAVGLKVDPVGNSYIASTVLAAGSHKDYLTMAYSTNGDSLWAKHFDGSQTNLGDIITDIEIDTEHNVYVTGTSFPASGENQIVTIKYSQTPMPEILKPTPYSKMIAGEKDSIKWVDPGWFAVNIICKTNVGTPSESELVIAQGLPSPTGKFAWSIPDTLLSYRSRIIIENANNITEKIESDIFRIKPYLITNLNPDSTYRAYQKNRDMWFPPNDSTFLWPHSFYNQFRYRSGDDPFTNLPYSAIVADSIFSKAFFNIHPDWVSWVNTFSVDACYFSAQLGLYKPSAVLSWDATNTIWGGSCFGMAASNAMFFENQARFEAKFQDFPPGFIPVAVSFTSSVIGVMNELFTYQFGNPSIAHQVLNYGSTTPVMVLNEVRQMLIADTVDFKTLSFFNNGGSGGHTLVVYGLKKDSLIDGLYYLQLYDNAFPMENTPIQISTLAGNGFWASTNYPGWGGNKGLYLERPSDEYYNQTTVANKNGNQSPFAVAEGELRVLTKSGSAVRISDGQGNITGYSNGHAVSEIPNTVPLMIKNGRTAPPYGYSLPANQYSVRFDSFVDDTVHATFFNGNRIFVYERGGATGTQSDRLHFDGGVSVVNPDAQSKTVKLINLVNETSQEKLTIVRNLSLAPSDSLKIINSDSNTVRLISFGSAKEYDIEFNLASGTGADRFVAKDIPLTPNTTHTISPTWSNLGTSQLNILIDEGNNGTIDDTVTVVNQVTGIQDQGSNYIPREYELSQNYPNPFNPSTTIRYALPQSGNIKLTVYDVLGNRVAELVNEVKPAGAYEVNFNAINLASGVYYYRIQAGSFVQVKKMIVMK